MAPNTDNFNADELNAPDWMSSQFFKEILTEHLSDTTVNVINVEISPATAKGDHYASVMFRAKVDYSTQKGKFNKSLIVKTMPELDTQKSEFIGDSNIFSTEIAMYTEVLPKFEQILRDAGEEITLCAKCLYHSLKPRQVMIFEDLVELNYDVIRKRPVTLEEIKAALEKLAKWHAVSFKLLKEKSKLLDELKYDVSTMPNFLEQDFMKTSMPDFLYALESSETLQKFKKYFVPLKDIINQRWVDIIREYRDKPRDDSYYVLCHGDFHMKNVMYRDNECMLLDFQMSNVGCMTNDVHYALYMFLNREERRNNYDELIYYYFTTFTKTLAIIGYQGKMPTLVEYRRQLFKNRYFELFLLTSFLPFFNSMRRGEDPGELIEDSNKRRQLYLEKEYQEELEYLLPHMLHLGYFDDLN